MSPSQQFDFFVIGGGSGGVRAARLAAQAGKRVGLAEAKHMGGTCVNVGCIPKKLFANASNFTADFSLARHYGYSSGQVPDLNWSELVQAVGRETTRLEQIYRTNLDKAGVEAIDGFARFISPHRIQVGSDIIEAERILIATGSKPKHPTYPGHEIAKISDDMFSLQAAPSSILIEGGGYIALEFASIFAGMGRRVRQVYRGERFLRGFDDDVRIFMEEQFRARDIEVRFNTKIKMLEKQGSQIEAVYEEEENDRASTDFRPEIVLSAIGRVPNTSGLGLENVGVLVNESGEIRVDDHYQTSAEQIYALGDVIGQAQLTPVAIREAMFLVNHLFGDRAALPLKYGTIASAVFTRPQIASIGATEQQLRANKMPLRIYKSTFRSLAYSLVPGKGNNTLMKILVHGQTDQVLGLHIVSDYAGEIVQGFGACIASGITKTQLDQAFAVHPTVAEELVTMREPVETLL